MDYYVNIRNKGGEKMKEKKPLPYFWKWLEENHHIANETIWWGVLILMICVLVFVD